MKKEINKINKTTSIPKNSRLLVYLLFFVICILIIFFNITKISGEDDFFWHIASGRYIIDNQTIPSTDVFGFVTSGQQWIPFEWGWDVITFVIFNFFGFAGAYIFKILLILSAFLIFYKILDKFKINLSLKIFFLLFLCWGMLFRFSIRPHLISYIFFIVLIYIITLYKYSDRKSYKILYFLPAIFCVWANFHMGVLTGIFLLSIFLLSEAIIFFLPQKFSTKEIPALSKKEILRLAAIYVLSLAALLINPNHINTYIYVFTHTQSSLITEIGEWKSPFYSEYSSSPAMITYKIFLASGIFIIYYSFRKKDLYAFLVFISFAIYSVRAARFTTDYNIICAIYIFLGINLLIERIKSTKIKNFIYFSNSFKLILIALILFQVVTVQNDNLFNEYFKYYRKWGIGPDRYFIPVGMMNFIKNTKINETGERPFNDYTCGGLFIWTFPGNKDFVDSRYVNDEIYNEYYTIENMQPGFTDKIKFYNMDYFMCVIPSMVNAPKGLSRNIAGYLSQNSNDWKLVYWDDASLLFVKNIPKFDSIIAKYEYKYISPYNYIFNKRMIDRQFAENKESVLSEIRRKETEEPEGEIIGTISKTYPLR